MSSLAIRNAGTLLTGRLEAPVAEGDAVLVADGTIVAIGDSADLAARLDAAEVQIDAQGCSVAPGLIDSHCHVVLGDYTPRQKTVDFLASYVHGGITSVVSPGEIHAPGRPHSAVGVTALAIAAKTCFDGFRPGGMRVHAGSVVLEPTLRPEHFAQLQDAGVHLAKFGFGRYERPSDGVDQVRWAQEHGITVMCHSGGASVPGSQPITPDDLLTLGPDVCGHINGGPTSLAEAGVDKIIHDSTMALQLVQAGNLRSSLRILEVAADADALRRVVIGSDTPTGTGVMPLGVIKTIAELSSMSDLAPAVLWAMATGNVADVWDLPAGYLEEGRAADLIVMDAPWGSLAPDALGALARGDIPGISAVVTAGEVRALRSRNTPAAARMATVAPAMDHLEGAH
ncbi:amidohydrolase family protein [Nitriliruptor alkaliphilus]|uniref:amidohydrolase family protein n=1 Tax=Nitriliruptor alkaliphilus TaxID=427918 RepID=UPI00069636D9|nr:amidohydrolase [Nitriliruptor alkaliphilus]